MESIFNKRWQPCKCRYLAVTFYVLVAWPLWPGTEGATASAPSTDVGAGVVSGVLWCLVCSSVGCLLCISVGRLVCIGVGCLVCIGVVCVLVSSV